VGLLERGLDGADRPRRSREARKRLGRGAFPELFERRCGPVAGEAGLTAEAVALGTARGSFLRRWRLLAIDGFEVDVPDSKQNAAVFGYAGSADNRSAFPKARVVALAECGTHAFVAAEADAYHVGEKTLAQRLYPRLRVDELLTADRGFYSWQAWDAAVATGAALLWRAPTQLELPVVRVLTDGTYLTALIAPTIRGRRGDLLAAARAGVYLSDSGAVPGTFDDRGLPVIHLARVIEYDVPDRAGNGTGELIVVLTSILHPDGPDGPAPTSWPPPTPALRTRDRERSAQDPPTRPRAGAALATARPGASGDLGLPDRARRDQRADRAGLHGRRPRPRLDLLRHALRLIRRTATGTADIPPDDWADRPPVHLTPSANPAAAGSPLPARHASPTVEPRPRNIDDHDPYRLGISAPDWFINSDTPHST
jgi:hypothetical protein